MPLPPGQSERRNIPALIEHSLQALAKPQTLRIIRTCGWSIVLMTLIWYAVFMVGRMGICAGGSDPSGYANNAKLIQEGRLFAEQRRIEGVTVKLAAQTYVPLGFEASGEKRMAPTYPLGLSALFVMASTGTSLATGMTLAMGLQLLGSLGVTYLLGRQLGLERGWAILGVGILAACPLFQAMSLQAMSDMPALFWTTLALVLGWESRQRRWLAGMSGVAVAMAVFIRPSNGLVLLPLIWALGADWRRWLWLGLGGLPGAVVWAVTNRLLYGRYLATGYGDASALFGWHNVGPGIANYAQTLPRLLPLIFFVAFILWRGRRRNQPRAALAMATTWALTLATFYAFYFHTQETWWYLRFLLPAFPALIGLSVCGLRQASEWVSGSVLNWRRVAAAVLVVCATGFGLKVQLNASAEWSALQFGRAELEYPKVCRQVASDTPENAVIFCMQTSGALFYEGPRAVVRWDWIDANQARALYAAASRAGRPVYAVLFPFELEWGCFKRGLTGRWVQIAEVEGKMIWRLEDAAGSME